MDAETGFQGRDTLLENEQCVPFLRLSHRRSITHRLLDEGDGFTIINTAAGDGPDSCAARGATNNAPKSMQDRIVFKGFESATKAACEKRTKSNASLNEDQTFTAAPQPCLDAVLDQKSSIPGG